MSQTYQWGAGATTALNYRPDNTIWFAAAMLPLVNQTETFWVFAVPIFILCAALVIGQCLLLYYLHPFVDVEEVECVEGSQLLLVVCSIVLCYAVVSGDLADCCQMWEYLRLIPRGDEIIVFESKQSRGVQPVEMWNVKSGGISHGYRLFSIFMYIIVRGTINLAVLLYGIGYIAMAESDDDKIKDCVAFLILTDLDGIFYKMAVPNIVKTDLERLPVLCLDPDQSAAYTLFSWLWNQFGAWIKPAFVAGWAVALERAYCLGGFHLLAYVVLGVACFGFSVFFCGSVCHGRLDTMGRLDVRNAVIGSEDQEMEYETQGTRTVTGQSVGTRGYGQGHAIRSNPHAGHGTGATPWAM